MRRSPVGSALILGLLLSFSAPFGRATHAETAEVSPSLQKLMRQMLGDVQQLNRAMLSDDDEAAAAAAERIADHPLVEPGQRATIARALGREMVDFKRHDTTVHDAAVALSVALRAGDRTTVAVRYGELVGGCLACHDRFRDRVREALGLE